MKTQEWIKKSLKARGYKLKDVAARLGITSPRMTDIINGHREVQSDEILSLSEMLGQSARSLLKSLEAGERIDLDADEETHIRIGGMLTGTGDILPITEAMCPAKFVPIPPDAQHSDGLYCFVMADDSMDSEVSKGSLIIAADPKKHYFPITPGSLLVVRAGHEKMALRKLVRDDSGKYWLTPVPIAPKPSLKVWPFLPTPVPGTANVGQGTLYTDDIVAGVLWVHRRYTPPPANDS